MRVRILLPRSVSRWLRKAAISRRVELGDVELGWLASEPALGVVEQQPERVAVGADRVRADVALGDQPVGEPCLQCRRERTHDCRPSVVLKAVGGELEQLRRGGQIPIAVARPGVPEICREQRHQRLHIGP